jgi:hypothetical protein
MAFVPQSISYHMESVLISSAPARAPRRSKSPPAQANMNTETKPAGDAKAALISETGKQKRCAHYEGRERRITSSSLLENVTRMRCASSLPGSICDTKPSDRKGRQSALSNSPTTSPRHQRYRRRETAHSFALLLWRFAT